VEVAILPNYKLVLTSTLKSAGGGRRGGCAFFRTHKARVMLLPAIAVDGLIPEVDVKMREYWLKRWCMGVGGRLHKVGEVRRLNRQEIACGRCWCEWGRMRPKGQLGSELGRGETTIVCRGKKSGEELSWQSISQVQLRSKVPVTDRDNEIHCGAGGPQRNYGSRMYSTDNIDNGT
jgi:hypothetical protein